MSNPVLITFAGYLLFLLGVGIYFCRRSVSIEDYLLGGRGMGAWVTALSAQASDMSGWLLMGLPGAVYLSGLCEGWIAIGLFIGTFLNWKFVAPRLRVYTEKTGSITLPCFFEARFRDPTGALRIVSAFVILVFFAIYASSGLVAAGKLFESVFGVTYNTAVLAGGGIIILYTFLGGFLAVCWTDLIQGLLMLFAVVVVPVLALGEVGGLAAIKSDMASKGISFSMIPQGGPMAIVSVISAMAWGLGYFGQPHILVRFMSAKSVATIKQSMNIAVVWVLFSLAGAVFVGLIGVSMFDGLSEGQQDKVFIYMIDKMFNPWVAGVMLAAILSAIMSTIDSQLLVCSSALTEDFYQKAIRKHASEKEVVFVGRLCVILISGIALVLALNPSDTILGIVAYAWGGLGAAFGPVVLFALFSRRTTWVSVLCGMVAGTAVLLVWKHAGLGSTMYEIVPGFITNCVVILIFNSIIGQKNEDVLREFNEIGAEFGSSRG